MIKAVRRAHTAAGDQRNDVHPVAERHRSWPTLAGRLLPERLAPWRGPSDNGNAPPRGVIGLSTGVRTFDHRWI
jgi:hypothetical protein